MTRKKRRSRTAQTAEPQPPTSQRATVPLSHSGLAMAVVSLLIACYVAVFYAAYDFRQEVLLLVFAPDVLLESWSGGGDLPLGFFDRLPLIGIALGIVAVAWASGSLLVRGWKLDERLTRLETELFSAGVGLSLWSIWTLLVGLSGLLHQTWLVWLPAVVTASLAGFQMAARRANREATPPAEPAERDWLWIALLALATPLAPFYLFAAVVPPIDFDVREYHLQAPKEWYQAGRITFMPHNVYGNMPLGAEMFVLLGMTLIPGDDGWWYGAMVGKVVMAIISLLTALMLFAAGRRTGSTLGGAAAALVYLSTPWVYLVSVSGRNEGVLGFYFLLAVYAVWLSRSVAEAEVRQSHWLKLGGFFAGSAAAVKYTALPFIALPLLLWVTFGERRFAWRAGLVFLVGALAAGGLWYAKNAALTGNPVYPLAGRWLDGAPRTEEKTEQWNRAHQPPPLSLSEAGAEARRMLLDSEWLSPLLLPLAALAVLATPQRRTALWLAGLLAFYLLGWFLFTHRLDRFWVPALVLVAWLAGIGATWSALGVWRHVLVAVLFWGCVANFLLIASAWYVPRAEDYLPDNRVAVRLETLRHQTTLPMHRYLNEHCPRGYSVLLVGDAQPFDLTVPVLYNTCFDDVWFDRLLRGKSRDERLEALRDRKIAYILVNWNEIRRYRSPGNYGFSDYITRDLVYDELIKEQKLLKKVAVEGGNNERAEIFEVVGVVPRPE